MPNPFAARLCRGVWPLSRVAAFRGGAPRMHHISSSTKHCAEGAGRNIANPLGDTAQLAGFGGQHFHGRGRQVQEQALSGH